MKTPSEERREIQESFKAGWDARDKLENELSKISIEISRLASIYEKDEENFLDSIETVDVEIAEAVYPLLQKKILILKQLWKIKVANEGHSNLFLFSRS